MDTIQGFVGDDQRDFSDLADQLIESAPQFNPRLGAVITAVVTMARAAPTAAKRINRPYYMLRLLVFIVCAGAVGGLVWASLTFKDAIKIASLKEMADLVGRSSSLIVAAPLIISVLFIERHIKRNRMLRALAGLEKFNDKIYAVQFNVNPLVGGETQELLRYLNACCGLLLLVRIAAGYYAEDSYEGTVLERIGNIRRGSNDNHRNILMKMAMIQARISSAPVAPVLA